MSLTNPFKQSRNHFEQSPKYNSKEIVSRVCIRHEPSFYQEVSPFEQIQDPSEIYYCVGKKATQYKKLLHYGLHPKESDVIYPIQDETVDIDEGFVHPSNNTWYSKGKFGIKDIGFVEGSNILTQIGTSVTTLPFFEALGVAPIILLFALMGSMYQFGMNCFQSIQFLLLSIFDCYSQIRRGDAKRLYLFELILLCSFYEGVKMVQHLIMSVAFLLYFPIMYCMWIVNGSWEWSFNFIKYLIQQFTDYHFLEYQTTYNLKGMTQEVIQLYNKYGFEDREKYSVLFISMYFILDIVRDFILRLVELLTFYNLSKWIQYIWETILQSGIQWIFSLISLPTTGPIVSVACLLMDVYTIPFFIKTYYTKMIYQALIDKSYVLLILYILISPLVFLLYLFVVLVHCVYGYISQVYYIHKLFFEIIDEPKILKSTLTITCVTEKEFKALLNNVKHKLSTQRPFSERLNKYFNDTWGIIEILYEIVH